jgi:hypothetical protein
MFQMDSGQDRTTSLPLPLKMFYLDLGQFQGLCAAASRFQQDMPECSTQHGSFESRAAVSSRSGCALSR